MEEFILKNRGASINFNVDVRNGRKTFLKHRLYLIYLLPHQAWNAVCIIHAKTFERFVIILDLIVLFFQSRALIRFLKKRRAVKFDLALDTINADAQDGRFEINDALYGGLRDQGLYYFLAFFFGYGAAEKIRAIFCDKYHGGRRKKQADENRPEPVPYGVAGVIRCADANCRDGDAEERDTVFKINRERGGVGEYEPLPPSRIRVRFFKSVNGDPKREHLYDE